MTTPNNKNQESCTPPAQRQPKGGVAGTDSKHINSSDPFGKAPKPKKKPANSKTD